MSPAVPAGAGPLTGSRSGLGWRSGVYVPGSNPSSYQAFANWRGRELDVAEDWEARQSWNDIVNPSWLLDAWRGTSYTKVFGVAMIPEGEPGVSIESCAAGAYNDKWRQFGASMTGSGLADNTIIRLGWEFNGDWYIWKASNPTAWAACWRNIVTSARERAPGLRWDWTVNRGSSQALSDPRAAYPGDGFVDIVGVDSYDIYPGVHSDSDWQAQYSGNYGLRFWADFAHQHGKQLSVPEWGVYPGTAYSGNNGGDNPFYIQKMVEFFRSVGTDLAYESYFNESQSYCASSLFGPAQNPAAAAAYRSLYSG